MPSVILEYTYVGLTKMVQNFEATEVVCGNNFRKKINLSLLHKIGPNCYLVK